MKQLTNVSIRIADEEINGFLNLDIVQDFYNIDSFDISYNLSALENDGEFIVDRAKNFIGKTCTITSESEEIGDSGSNEAFSFQGIVMEIRSNKTHDETGDNLTIHGTSPEIILDGKPTCRTFKDQSLEQIVNEILSPYPRNILNPVVSPKLSDQLTYVVQYMESDYNFLRRLSIRYGEWFFYTGQELIFGELPDIDEEKLMIGFDLDTFQFDLRASPSGNMFRYIHDSEKDILTWESGNNSVDQQLNEYGQHAYEESNQLFSEQATRTFNHLNIDPADYQSGLERAGNLEETVDALNNAGTKGDSRNLNLKIGQEIVVSRRGSDKSTKSYGRYRITSISHSCDQVLNYQNSFDAMPAECEIPENTDPDAVIKSDPIRGEVSNNADPEKYGRLIVNFGWVSGQDDSTPWIRCITPYVMKEGGNFFVPEIGTDVLVAFEDGDMERPYVMGAFNTSPNQFCPDPAWGDATPDIKAIRTRSGHTIEFHDVDGSELIRIYDKDEVNEIILDPVNKELKIHSTETLKIEAKEIEITAEQGIKMESGQGFTVESGQDFALEASNAVELKGMTITGTSDSDYTIDAGGGNVSIKGVNVEVAANAQFKAAGNAGSEVSTSAILILKGSLVNIN